MVKIACLDDAFSEVFIAKKRKEEKEKLKKFKKIEKPKDVGHFLKISISAHARAKISQNVTLVERN